jgi:hypothetical protein
LGWTTWLGTNSLRLDVCNDAMSAKQLEGLKTTSMKFGQLSIQNTRFKNVLKFRYMQQEPY